MTVVGEIISLTLPKKHGIQRGILGLEWVLVGISRYEED